MKPTRNVVAIALVAAALCADRAVVAAPVEVPPVGNVAGRLVSRLSVRFRRVVPSVRVYQTRCAEPVAAQINSKSPRADDESACFGTRLLPLLIHLPPPTWL